VTLGLFGKLPAHGDFISRGLAAPQRKALDHWVTHNIGQRVLPAGGLRARLTLGGARMLIVIVQSHDKSGRVFPFVAVAADTGQERSRIDEWCDEVAQTLGEAVSHVAPVAVLMERLQPAPHETDSAPVPTDIMWQHGQSPQPLAIALAQLSSD